MAHLMVQEHGAQRFGQHYRKWVGLEQMINLLVSTHVAEHNAGLDWRRLLFWGEGLSVSGLHHT